MKNKRILTVIALCMAALTLAFAFSSCAKKKTPTQFVFGIDLEKGKDSYLASIFGKADSNFSLIGIFGENGEMFDNIKKNAELGKTLKALAEKYEKLIIRTVDANAKTSLENGTATIELNSESIKKIAKELYSAAKNDKELRDTLNTLLSAPSIGKPGTSAEEDPDDWDFGDDDSRDIASLMVNLLDLCR